MFLKTRRTFLPLNITVKYAELVFQKCTRAWNELVLNLTIYPGETFLWNNSTSSAEWESRCSVVALNKPSMTWETQVINTPLLKRNFFILVHKTSPDKANTHSSYVHSHISVFIWIYLCFQMLLCSSNCSPEDLQLRDVGGFASHELLAWHIYRITVRISSFFGRTSRVLSLVILTRDPLSISAHGQVS